MTSLTAILHQDVLNAPSGLDARTIANLLPRNYHTFMSELGRAPGHKFGADLVVPLSKLTGSDNGVDYICRELGGKFVRIPTHLQKRPPSEQQLVTTIKEFAEFIGAVTTAYLDGKVTRDEFKQAKEEANEAIASALVLLDLMEADIEEDI
ncbi:MAG: hypothetical protein DELT_00524 [Desulfovibrio sp.]